MVKWHEASEAHFLRDTILIVAECDAYPNSEKRKIPSFDLKKIDGNYCEKNSLLV